MDRWEDGCMHASMDDQIDGQMTGWLNGKMYRWKDGQMDG